MTQPDEFIASSLRETADQAASRVRAIDLDVVLAEGSRRARRRSKQRRASATVALVAAIVVVFVVPLPHLWLRRQTTTTTTPTHKVTKSAATVSVARLIAGHWSKMSPAPIAPRAGEAVVWTGQELLVWGGSTTAVGGSKLYGTGAAYDPSTNSWRMLPPAPLSPRTDASAVWTGNEMVIFGGYDYESSIGGTRVTNNAASYDPSTNSWRMLPPAPLSPRAGAIAVWTGKEVIVLGGQPASGAGSDGDGAAFDPTTNTWQHIAAPLPPRGHPLAWQTAVRAGNELIAFSLWWEVHSLGSGGFTVSGGADLFTYDLATGRWRWVPARANALGDPAETLWTGRLLIVRGEPYYCHACKIAEIAPEVTDLYDPARNSWTRIVPDPLAVSVNLSSVWVGNALFSFNPSAGFSFHPNRTIRPGDASLYDPSTGRWSRLPTAPFGCSNPQSPIWTERQILIYCPQSTGPGITAAGLVYTPAPLTRPAPAKVVRGFLLAVACNGTTSCMAVGSSNRPGSALAEHWNGSEWSTVSTPTRATYRDAILYGLACVSASDCTAVGRVTVTGPVATTTYTHTLVEHWNGQRWAIVASPNRSEPDNQLNGISCTSAANCTAVGWSGVAAPMDIRLDSLIEHWNGSKWTILNSPNPPTSTTTFITSIACIKVSACMAVGEYLPAEKFPYSKNYTAIERWDGARWSVVTSPDPSGSTDFYLSSVACPSSSSCTAVGVYIGAGSIGYTLVEHWNGTAWSIVRSPSPPSAGKLRTSELKAIACVGTSNCNAVGDAFNGVILVEHWNGSSWSIVQSRQPGGLSAVACASATNCTAVGGTRTDALIESWNGSSWSIVQQ